MRSRRKRQQRTEKNRIKFFLKPPNPKQPTKKQTENPKPCNEKTQQIKKPTLQAHMSIQT